MPAVPIPSSLARFRSRPFEHHSRRYDFNAQANKAPGRVRHCLQINRALTDAKDELVLDTAEVLELSRLALNYMLDQ